MQGPSFLSFPGAYPLNLPLAGTSGRLITSVLCAERVMSCPAQSDRKQGSVSYSVFSQSPQWSDMARPPWLLTLIAALLAVLSAKPSKILNYYWFQLRGDLFFGDIP